MLCREPPEQLLRRIGPGVGHEAANLNLLARKVRMSVRRPRQERLLRVFVEPFQESALFLVTGIGFLAFLGLLAVRLFSSFVLLHVVLGRFRLLWLGSVFLWLLVFGLRAILGFALRQFELERWTPGPRRQRRSAPMEIRPIRN